MQILKTAVNLASYLNNLRKADSTISVGFVPTMGALHAGHISLVEKSKEQNTITVCSVFVNPTQFGNAQDLDTYPRTVESDIAQLIEHGCDILFMPEVGDVYPPGYEQRVYDLEGLDLKIEGASRPGHFQGVCNVLHRFFDIIHPDRAYFGQKDYQQTLVAKRLVKLIDLPVDIVVVPIAREPHGLAMSSRNVRLSEEGRQQASVIHEALMAISKGRGKQSLDESMDVARALLLRNPKMHIDYLLAVDAESLQEVHDWGEEGSIAVLTVVEFEGVRLLDNVII